MLVLLSKVTAEEVESGRTLPRPLLIPLVADHLPPIIVPDVLSRLLVFSSSMAILDLTEVGPGRRALEGVEVVDWGVLPAVVPSS